MDVREAFFTSLFHSLQREIADHRDYDVSDDLQDVMVDLLSSQPDHQLDPADQFPQKLNALPNARKLLQKYAKERRYHHKRYRTNSDLTRALARPLIEPSEEAKGRQQQEGGRKQFLQELLQQLTQRERKVVLLRCGIHTRPHKMREIAEILRISKPRCTPLWQAALRKISALFIRSPARAPKFEVAVFA